MKTFTIDIPGDPTGPFELGEYAFLANPESGGTRRDLARARAAVEVIGKLQVGETFDLNHGPLDRPDDGDEAWIVTRTS